MSERCFSAPMRAFPCCRGVTAGKTSGTFFIAFRVHVLAALFVVSFVCLTSLTMTAQLFGFFFLFRFFCSSRSLTLSALLETLFPNRFFYGCPSLDATASADSWCLKALLRYMSRNTKASHQRLLSSFEGDNLGEVITREAMFRGVAIGKSLYSEYKQRGDNMWNCCFLFSISVAAIEIIEV